MTLPAAAATAMCAATAGAAAPANTARLQHNENPFGPSKRALDAISAAIASAWAYADEEANELRRAIAIREGLAAENVIVTEGSAELLKLVALTQVGANRDVVAARPTYTMLPHYAAQRGATVSWVDLDREFKLDLPAMESRMSARTAAMYVCNPNNPSGTLLDATALRQFVDSMSQRALVVVDEAYLDFSADWRSLSMIDRVTAGKNVLVSRSFSKLHALAGLRVGYGLGQAETIRQLEAARMSRLNRLGIVAASASYSDLEYQAYSRQAIRATIASTSSWFDELNVAYVRSHANFMMFNTGGRSSRCFEFMRARGVMIRPILEAPGTWARISMGRPEAMQAFAAAARAFFKNG